MSINHRAALDAALIHALKSLGGAVTTRQLWAAAGKAVPLADVTGALRRLCNAGLVIRVRRAVYRLA